MAEEKSLQLTKQLHVKVPENHIPTFANSVQINVANEEVTLQFIFVRPNTSQGTMVSEIIIHHSTL